MTDATVEGPARRFLHVCYCCDDAQPTVDFFTGPLRMKSVMRTPLEPSDGNLLGMDREIVSLADFVYDHRGPRESPSIEVQHWDTPATEGDPLSDQTHAGIQSAGFAVQRCVTSPYGHLVAIARLEN